MKWAYISIFILLLSSGPLCAANFQHGEHDLSEPVLFEQGDLFLRPSFTLSEEYTDNLFKTPNSEERDFITRLTPGIRIGFPWAREAAPYMAVRNRVPGGVSYQNFGRPERRFFEGHLSYSKQYDYYKNFSEEDTSIEKVETVLLAESRAKGGIRLFGSLINGFDPFDVGETRSQDEYENRTFGVVFSYRAPERFTLNLEGRQFALDYDDPQSTFRNREDLVWSTSLAYRFSGKVQGVVEYKNNDIDYDGSAEDDITQSVVSAGIDWRFTEKTWGKFRVGNESRESSVADDDLLVYEALLSYRLTRKTRLHLSASRGTEETDIDATRSLLVYDNRLKLFQQYTPKLSAQFVIKYSIYEYEDQFSTGGLVGYRDDEVFSISSGLNYALTRWIISGVSYRYKSRDSNFNDYDYTENTCLFVVKVVL